MIAYFLAAPKEPITQWMPNPLDGIESDEFDVNEMIEAWNIAQNRTNELKIKISADLDELKKGLNQADDAVDKFSTTAGKSANTASAAIDKVSASI